MQPPGAERDLQIILVSVLDALHSKQVRQDFWIVNIRTGIALRGIRDCQCKRLAEELTSRLGLRADIQDLRLDLLHHQRHFTITKCLQLPGQINEGRLDL